MRRLNSESIMSTNDKKYNGRKKSYYERNKTKVLAGIKKYYLANPNRIKRNQLKTRYALTLERFNEMVSEQENKCRICQDEFSEKNKPFVDHNHRCCKGQKS